MAKKQSSPKLGIYNSVDPDVLYENFPDGSITFYYVPASGKLYIEQYPTAHHDMMDDPALFKDVYADLLKTEPYSRQLHKRYAGLGVRSRALIEGRALLGRIALDGATPIITFWRHTKIPTDQSTLAGFFKALYAKMPAFKQFQANTVLKLVGEPPVTVAQFLGGDAPQRAVRLKPQAPPISAPVEDKDEKKYDIGGHLYSVSDLQHLRAAVHTKGDPGPGLPRNPYGVLCHPDLAKHGLERYRPNSGCPDEKPRELRPTHPAVWRRKGLEAGIWPPPYDYGEALDFKTFLGVQDLFHS
jgi:hypothetical protein